MPSTLALKGGRGLVLTKIKLSIFAPDIKKQKVPRQERGKTLLLYER